MVKLFHALQHLIWRVRPISTLHPLTHIVRPTRCTATIPWTLSDFRYQQSLERRSYGQSHLSLPLRNTAPEKARKKKKRLLISNNF